MKNIIIAAVVVLVLAGCAHPNLAHKKEVSHREFVKIAESKIDHLVSNINREQQGVQYCYGFNDTEFKQKLIESFEPALAVVGKEFPDPIQEKDTELFAKKFGSYSILFFSLHNESLLASSKPPAAYKELCESIAMDARMFKRVFVMRDLPSK